MVSIGYLLLLVSLLALIGWANLRNITRAEKKTKTTLPTRSYRSNPISLR